MRYKIVKSFMGSPDGRFSVQYTEGEKVELTDALAEVAVHEGWAVVCENEDDGAETATDGADGAPAKSARKR